MSFLTNYREFTKGTEAHPTYHTFAGLVALSSIVSRRVWIEQGYFKVFPNLYVVLVGPPGNRKTSAMDIAHDLIRAIGNIPFSAEKTSKEKLVLDILAQERQIDSFPADHPQKIYTPMTIFSSELSEFLGADSSGMINFLTTIYDRKVYDSRTKNKGDVAIVGPYLTLISCTTPDWITTYLRSDVISGGFSRRAIFVLETAKAGRITFPKVTAEAKVAWDKIIAHAAKLSKISGEFKWDPEAATFYDNWYQKLEMPTDETVVGYYETKHMQLLKISMLIALSDSTDLILKKEHLLFGLDLLKLAEENLARVFAGIGRNELNAAASKVLDMMQHQPPLTVTLGLDTMTAPACPEKKLYGLMFRLVDSQEMDRVLQHLINTDQLCKVVIQLPNESITKVYVLYKARATIKKGEAPSPVQ